MLEPSTPLAWGWALDAMCDLLEANARGEAKDVLINVFPGAMKSLLTDTFLPAYMWGPLNIPSTRFISASYAQALSIRNMGYARQLMNSEWYQARWGDQWGWLKDRNEKTNYANDKTGWRVASSVGSALTGWRGDRIIIDDPHSPQSVESDAERESALAWFTETLPTRVNDPKKSSTIVIMQRLHEEDISGLILTKDFGYTHLMLPMEFEPDRKCLSLIHI